MVTYADIVRQEKEAGYISSDEEQSWPHVRLRLKRPAEEVVADAAGCVLPLAAVSASQLEEHVSLAAGEAPPPSSSPARTVRYGEADGGCAGTVSAVEPDGDTITPDPLGAATSAGEAAAGLQASIEEDGQKTMPGLMGLQQQEEACIAMRAVAPSNARAVASQNEDSDDGVQDEEDEEKDDVDEALPAWRRDMLMEARQQRLHWLILWLSLL